MVCARITSAVRTALIPFCLLAGASASVGAARAYPQTVYWELEDAGLDDGATASGSFEYNADTGDFTAIEINTTAGSTFAAATFDLLDCYECQYDPNFDLLNFKTSDDDNLGEPTLRFGWQPSYSLSAPGEIPLLSLVNAEMTCLDSSCGDWGYPYVVFTSGWLVGAPMGSPAPEPSTWVEMLIGLAGTGFVRLLMARRSCGPSSLSGS